MSTAPQATEAKKPTRPEDVSSTARRNDGDEDPTFEIPDGDQVDDGMEVVINVSGQPAKFDIAELPKAIVLKPGQSTRIPRPYTQEYKGAGQGDPLAPVIMRLTGDRVVPGWHKAARGHKDYHGKRPPILTDIPFEQKKPPR